MKHTFNVLRLPQKPGTRSKYQDIKTKLASLLLFLLDIKPDSFSSYTLSHASKEVEDEVNLQGLLERRCAQICHKTFQVMRSSFLLNVMYMKDVMDDITVEIFDGNGQSRYFNIVNPVYGEQLLINITLWKEGNYLITFGNASGEILSGEFEVVH